MDNNRSITFKEINMEEIFIQALVNRAKTEEGLIEMLPEDVKVMVEEKLSTDIQEAEIVE